MTAVLAGWAGCAPAPEGAWPAGGARAGDSGLGETGLEIDVDRPWPLPCKLVWERRDNEGDGLNYRYTHYSAVPTRDGWLWHTHAGSGPSPGPVLEARAEVLDAQGNPLSKGGLATWSYDERGRMVREQRNSPFGDPSNNSTKGFYYSDSVGYHGYGGEGLLSSTLLSTEATPQSFTLESWDYDPRSGLLIVHERGTLGWAYESFRETFSYDGRGRLVRKTEENDALGRLDQEWEYGYDDEDQLRWEVTTKGGASSWKSYEHDGLQTIEYDYLGMTLELLGTTTTTRDEAGNRLSYIFDNLSPLAEFSAPGVDTWIEWTYDAYGNLTSESYFHPDGTLDSRQEWRFECR